MSDPTGEMIALLTILIEDPYGVEAANDWVKAMDEPRVRAGFIASCCHIADLIRRHAEAERIEPRVVLRDIALTAATRSA